MRAEVRQRIEQIRQGKVPAGYHRIKNTICPIDWKYKKIGEYLIRYHVVSQVNNQYPVLTSSRRGIFLQSQYYKREIASEDNTGYNVVPFGYFTYRHMSDDNIFRFNINNIVENGIVSTIYPVFTTTREIDDIFLKEALNNGEEFRRYALLQKQGGSRTYMYFDTLKKFFMSIPPLSEQHKISTVSLAQDQMIALREKLLAEKLRQKQYLMQVLLTGKKRLPGFNGRWSHIKIGDSRYTKINYDSLSNKTEENFQFKYITLENVDNGKLKQTIHCTYKNAPSRARRVVHKEDILYGLVRPNLHSHLLANEMMEGMVCSTGFCVIRCNTALLLPYFLFSVIMSEMIDRQANQIMTGSNYPAVSSVDVENMEIDIPCDIKEQQAVIAILSSADQEIDLLRQALEQERQKKKALMQLLLSGIVRVKP